MVVMCYASGIIEYGRRTLELSNAPFYMKQDINIIENFKVRLDLPHQCLE